MSYLISGIQQIGIGVSDAKQAFDWYRKNFGTDVLLFDDVAEAALMKQYTGNEINKRHALLALNLKGGAGLEIWQFKNRTPRPSSTQIQLGDTGIFSVKLKSSDIKVSFDFFKSRGVVMDKAISKTPSGQSHFFIQDPFGNVFEIVESTDWFSTNHFHLGGVAGCTIGVSDIEKSKKFYEQVLGYDEVIYDKQGCFDDYSIFAKGRNKVRRVLLTHREKRKGSFSKLLGSSQLELVQALDRTPKKIFENRYWGDLGFIHVCFDVNGMNSLKEKCKEMGHAFTVDSSVSFEMEKAAGHFSYAEDLDGTLIEFVETHKIPIIKKMGWYLDLKNRNPQKPLPNWMLKALRFNRVK
jgi:catechol 2,3-dioxygenase-like lactoylglutathione lyase family enzyme